MKELLDKLSSYNLFNYLLPGTIFVALSRRFSTHSFKDDSIVVELFLFYFIGMVIAVSAFDREPRSRRSKRQVQPYKDSFALVPRTRRSRFCRNRTTPTVRCAPCFSRWGCYCCTTWRSHGILGRRKLPP